MRGWRGDQWEDDSAASVFGSAPVEGASLFLPTLHDLSRLREQVLRSLDADMRAPSLRPDMDSSLAWGERYKTVAAARDNSWMGI